MNIQKRIIKNLFPNGKGKALTVSFDDMVLQDKRLLEIFNRNGIKGTFNLNSGWFGKSDTIKRSNIELDHSHFGVGEIVEIYQGHEVAAHTVNHPGLDKLSDEMIITEVMEDRHALEQLFHYPVTGFAYPNGAFDERIISVLARTGLVYARTIKSHLSFNIPEQYLEWHPTCPQRYADIESLGERFASSPPISEELQLFYIWGHSYEMDIDNSWDRISSFYEKIGGREDIWYAANID
ncbi:MAG TPA: polysaccharide deacetylase, partial [Prolixibacteraceae bacterium]|nr:polysaccharide deacetylase [Prolixibacteraceae bacterium]